MDRAVSSRPNLLLIFLGELVVVGLAVVVTYNVMQARAKNPSGTPPLPTQTPVAQTAGASSASTAQMGPAPSSSQDFRTAKYGGMFSYEYPAGWHVAELWQDQSGRSYIVMDPEPINTAPRGGSLGKFNLTIQNGKQNPDEVFQKEMANFNDESYTDIVKEEIDAEIGKVFHFTGKMKGPMMEGEPVDSYYFTFHKNPSDPVNQQVVSASLVSNADTAIASMFRHVVLSFKEL